MNYIYLVVPNRGCDIERAKHRQSERKRRCRAPGPLRLPSIIEWRPGRKSMDTTHLLVSNCWWGLVSNMGHWLYDSCSQRRSESQSCSKSSYNSPQGHQTQENQTRPYAHATWTHRHMDTRAQYAPAERKRQRTRRRRRRRRKRQKGCKKNGVRRLFRSRPQLRFRLSGILQQQGCSLTCAMRVFQALLRYWGAQSTR